MSRITSPEALKAYREELIKARPADQKTIAVCAGTGCNAYGSRKVVDAFRDELEKHGLTEKIRLRPTGCHGFCERGTLVLFHPDGVLYQRVKAEDVPEIIEETVIKGEYLEKHFYEHPVTHKKYKLEQEIPFYKHQKRLILGKNGHIDPTSIDDYIEEGGYAALSKAFDHGRRQGAGRGKEGRRCAGAEAGGFPAGRKWETCRNAPSDKRYVICNADEGDPGAFMDRSILEGNPHSVIEGMIIGAYTIGSDEGYVYVRHEYPLAVERLGIALQQAREKGFLGEEHPGQRF